MNFLLSLIGFKDNKKITINLILNGTLTLVSYIFPLITVMYITRVLSPTNLGRVSFAGSVVSYFLLLSQLGMPVYGLKKCAEVVKDKAKTSQTVFELLVINQITFITSALLLLIAVFIVPDLRDEKLLFLIMGSQIFFNSLGCEWYYKATENYSYITKRTLAFKIIALILMVLLVKSDENIYIYAILTIFAQTGNYLCNFLNLRRYIDFRSVKRLELLHHIKPLFTFFLMSCVVSIYINLDILMLGIMKSKEAVGYYSIVGKLKNPLTALGGIIWNVTLPTSTAYWKEKKIYDFHLLIRKSLRIIYLIQIPMTFYCLTFSKYIIEFVAGSNYTASIMPFNIILLTLIPIGISNILGGQAIIPSGNEKKLLLCELTGAIVNIILNFILIYYYAINGAAIATLAAETIVTIMTVIYYKRIVNYSPCDLNHMARPFVAALVAVLASFSMRFAGLNAFFTLLISAIIYFAVYALVLFIIPRLNKLYRKMLLRTYKLSSHKKAKYYCSCCDRKVKRFTDLKLYNSPELFNPSLYKDIEQKIICSYCHSLPRHRILSSYLNDNADIVENKKILYFAYEKCTSLWFDKHNIKVTTADLFKPADLKLDITDIDLPDSSFDTVICFHVLEHVNDYKKALAELSRILTPGGTLLIAFPIDQERNTVYEEEAPTPGERIAKFGQFDHIRVFGKDSVEMLEPYFKSVSSIDTQSLPEEILPVIGPAIYDSNLIFVCKKEDCLCQ